MIIFYDKAYLIFFLHILQAEIEYYSENKDAYKQLIYRY